MFKIKNNAVYLSRGEDAVYERAIIRGDRYATPYILKRNIVGPRVRLTVKTTKNAKDSILFYECKLGDEIPRFVTQKVIDYVRTESEPHPSHPQAYTLYRMITYDTYHRAKFSYEYHDGTQWHEYAFTIRIVIDHEDTVNLVAATYYYDIALITRKNDSDTGEIDYSEQWLEPTEFVIGGSFGE